MRIALIQQHATEDDAANLSRALDQIGRAADGGADVVAFAELATTRFFPQFKGHSAARESAQPIPGPISDQVAERAQKHGVVVVFNMYESAADGRFFDSSPVFDSDGAFLGITRMVHITDFDWFHEKEYYDPGDRGALVYETQAGRIGVAASSTSFSRAGITAGPSSGTA